MDIMMKIIFYLSALIIIWAMIGYSLSLKVIGKIYKRRKLKKDYSFHPTITVMVVAHNEEKVIREKLENIIQLNYPADKIEFLIASDNSTDMTNQYVKEFIKKYDNIKIRLYEVKKRQGKTNAQNEAQKVVKTEFLVMTDANSIIEKNSIKELMAAFTSKNIAYVTGRLAIVNSDDEIGNSESSYWNQDLLMREIESNIQSITAGNGALYACRTNEYFDFDPIMSHDSAMPLYFSLQGKRAICNHDAIAYEKAGETLEDEFSRKVRMNRRILSKIIPDIKLLNVFKYRWFSYFYFGHRTSRYLLWLAHSVLLVTSAILINDSKFYLLAFIGQTIFYILSIIQLKVNSSNKVLRLINYYTMTVFSQYVGVYNILTGKAKPFWEKAESTR